MNFLFSSLFPSVTCPTMAVSCGLLCLDPLQLFLHLKGRYWEGEWGRLLWVGCTVDEDRLRPGVGSGLGCSEVGESRLGGVGAESNPLKKRFSSLSHSLSPLASSPLSFPWPVIFFSSLHIYPWCYSAQAALSVSSYITGFSMLNPLPEFLMYFFTQKKMMCCTIKIEFNTM